MKKNTSHRTRTKTPAGPARTVRLRHRTPARRAVLYLRTETVTELDRHGDDIAIREQRKLCRAAAKQIGASLIAEFSDQGASGRQPDRRGLNAMLERTAVGDIHLVITPSMDRLSREPSDLLVIENMLGRRGVGVIAATGIELGEATG